MVKKGEVVLVGSHITPLSQASTHVHADPTRTRKLLMHREEINRLVGKVERAGYTLAPLNLHYKGGRIKLEVGLAKGKKQHDKRDAIKEREWTREQQRLVRNRTGVARARATPRDRRPAAQPRELRPHDARVVPRAGGARLSAQGGGAARPPARTPIASSRRGRAGLRRRSRRAGSGAATRWP